MGAQAQTGQGGCVTADKGAVSGAVCVGMKGVCVRERVRGDTAVATVISIIR